MTRPFMIWTLRRTGGTTLMNLMMDLSEHHRVDHEPFNWDRCYGAISKAWYDEGDSARLESELNGVLAQQPLIKHCHELHPDSFNDALFAAALRHDYQLMVLDRRDEVGRILSLELAKLTGAWGKMGSAERYQKIESGEETLEPIDIASAKSHMRQCHKRRLALRSRFEAAGVSARVVYFEDIYACPIEEGRPRVRAILKEFGLTHEDPTEIRKQVTAALKWKGQDSSRMLPFVPNIEAARAALTELADSLPPVF